ncbi:MAG: CBS domain-containing protein [Bryobacteraceae bacterium]|jgi:CBS domain-containing protein|nr:CBS domain-containing protein [Bryobacteraceae bacterium]
MKVRDIMVSDPVTVKPSTPVEEVARLFVERRIGGVPVVSDEGVLLGIVTETDLFLKERGVPFSMVKLPSLFNEWVKPEQLQELYANARRHTAADIMTQRLVTATPDTEICQVAEWMMRHRIKRVPVVEGGRLVGIVTRHDLIRRLACNR